MSHEHKVRFSVVMELCAFPVVVSMYVHEHIQKCSVGSLHTIKVLTSTQSHQVVGLVPDCCFINECNCEHVTYVLK
jgi:hypothetical protein